jgi:hypothetical protein
MLELLDQGRVLCDGWNRRECLRIGGLSLAGLTLPRLLQARESPASHAAAAKSVIVLFMSGGLPQHETFDTKPEAPREIRGDFDTVPTKTPGLFIGELLPQIASLTDRMAVIRSMVTGDNAHSTSGYQMLTGVPHAPLSRENAPPGRPNDWPAYNAVIRGLCPPRNGLPSSIALPRRLANNGGQDPWPGTDGGRLGRSFDPWLLECDPNAAGFTMPGAEFPDGLSQVRLDRRLSLLDQVSSGLNRLEDRAADGAFDLYREQAISLIAGGQGRAAFDLNQEPDKVRDRYGRTQWGQSVLLARRLVEAGVSLVQVQWASTDKKLPNSGGWDTHEKHSESLKGWLMPALDQTYSALLTDLEDRGLLDETLVCLVTEFGHTPKFNKRLGRDHWGSAFSIALAGGGIRGGVVHGATDDKAAHVVSDPVRPCDYLATIYHCLGFSPETMVHDVEGRPLPISAGHPVQALL